MSSTEEFVDLSSRDAPVRGFLHRPATANGEGIVLTHGAGANSNAPLLVALADRFCAVGLTVLRCDLPFRQLRPHGPPPRGSAEHDQQGLRAALAAMRRLAPGRIFLGGHSYGGRQSSMLAAAEPRLLAFSTVCSCSPIRCTRRAGHRNYAPLTFRIFKRPASLFTALGMASVPSRSWLRH